MTRKIHRQLAEINSPPRTGPADEATAPPIAHIDTARARRPGSGYAWAISAIDEGITTAAAVPCTNRNATSSARPGASPQATEAITKPTTPSPNARFAPIRSVSDPAESRNAANIRV